MRSRMSDPKSMRGFSLLETMITLTILASVTMYTLHWQSIAANTDKGRNLAQQYLTLNDAVNNYMVTHSQALNALSSVCSETTFSYDPTQRFDTAKGKSTARLAVNCNLVVSQGLTVVNGLQPTIDELVALGFHPKQSSYGPLLQTINVVKEANVNGSAPNSFSVFTPARFFINIAQVCLQRGTITKPNQIATTPTTPGPTGCPATATTAFTSLIFNTQPYDFKKESKFAYASLIGSAISKMGPDASHSDYLDSNYTQYKGELISKPLTTTPNPIRYVYPKTGVNVGLNSIIALRGGYGAAYANQHSRLDGSNIPTADWSFGGHNVADIKDLTVLNMLQTDALKTNKLKLASRVVDTPCDVNQDGLANQGDTVLICKRDIWKNLLSGTVNANEYYEVSFTDAPTQSALLNATYCKDGACTAPTNIGTLSGSAIKIISTQLKKSDWLPVIQGFSQSNNDATLPSKLGVWIDVATNSTHQISFNYQDRKDLAKLQIRFYRINS